jgi:hypothetical protein
MQDENARLHAAIAALQADVATLQNGKHDPAPASQNPNASQVPPRSDPGQNYSPNSLKEGEPSPIAGNEQSPPTAKSPGCEAIDASPRVAEPASQLQTLARELAAARARAATLATENERLMELSNKLRSQRDRATILGFPHGFPNQDVPGPIPALPLPRPRWHAQYIPPHFFNSAPHMYNIPSIPAHVWHGELQPTCQAPEPVLSLPGSLRKDDMSGEAEDGGEEGRAGSYSEDPASQCPAGATSAAGFQVTVPTRTWPLLGKYRGLFCPPQRESW